MILYSELGNQEPEADSIIKIFILAVYSDVKF